MVTTANQTFVQSPLAVSAGSPTQSTDYPGFAVYHTTDGTLPTVLSGFAQTFEITNTTTVVWEGYRNGYTPQYVTNTYTYAGPVMASPSPGTYDQNINVTLTGPVGSSVTYSLDGTNWLSYTGPVSLAGYVDASITIQATYSGGPTSQFVYSFAGGASSSYAGLAPFLFQTPQYCTSVGESITSQTWRWKRLVSWRYGRTPTATPAGFPFRVESITGSTTGPGFPTRADIFHSVQPSTRSWT